MADIAITAADVAPVQVFEQFTAPAAEAIDAGEIVRLDTTSAKFTLANATSAAEGRAFGMAANSAAAGETLTVVKKGIMDLGDALDAETFDETLRLSNTDGALDDGAGVPTGTYNIGRVIGGWGATTPDKLFLVEL